jgi:hypothetical protein
MLTLERQREALLRKRAESLMNCTLEEIYTYLYNAIRHDRNILIPIRAYSSYPYIRWSIAASLILSLVFGFDGILTSSAGIRSFADILLGILWFIAGASIWIEFNYMQGLIKRLHSASS